MVIDILILLGILVLVLLLLAFTVINFKLPLKDPEYEYIHKKLEKLYKKNKLW